VLLALAAFAAVFVAPGGADVAQDAQEPQRPADLEWLEGPPPEGARTAVMKTNAVFVGVVLAPDADKRGTHSGTVIAVPAPGKTAGEFEGMVIEDPEGKKHPLKSGALITYEIAAAGGTAAWRLFDRDNKVAATATMALRPDAAAPGTFPKDPVLCEGNRAVTLPGPFDGDAGNTAFRVDKEQGRVLAESSGAAIVVPPDLAGKRGKIPIEVEEAGKTFALDGRLLEVDVQGPTKMQRGRSGELGITIFGFEGMRGAKLDRPIRATAINTTPTIVDLGDGKISRSVVVDSNKIRRDGTFAFKFRFTALQVGMFRFLVPVRQAAFCCDVACAPCRGTWFCSSTGIVQCSNGNCAGGCAGHSGGAACGKWFCSCEFKACVCAHTGDRCS
jgi:hypothetical protein